MGIVSQILTLLRYLSQQPKIKLLYRAGSYSSGPGSTPNLLRCRWKGSFELYNESAHDATEIKENWPPVLSPYIEEIKGNVIKSGKRLNRRLKIERELPKDEVIKRRKAPEGHIPDEIQAFSCVVSYRNRYGKYFYTKFVKDGNAQSYSYHWYKPKLNDT